MLIYSIISESLLDSPENCQLQWPDFDVSVNTELHRTASHNLYLKILYFLKIQKVSDIQRCLLFDLPPTVDHLIKNLIPEAKVYDFLVFIGLFKSIFEIRRFFGK